MLREAIGESHSLATALDSLGRRLQVVEKEHADVRRDGGTAALCEAHELCVLLGREAGPDLGRIALHSAQCRTSSVVCRHAAPNIALPLDSATFCDNTGGETPGSPAQEDGMQVPAPHHTESEPSMADLAAIEREWPLIAAELALLDAEVAALQVEGGFSALDWRRLRRAERLVLREAAALFPFGYEVPPPLAESLAGASAPIDSDDREVA